MKRTKNTELTDEQKATLQRLKNCFPFRIVFGAINPETGEFIADAKPTKAKANRLARKGWLVWTC